MSGSEGYVILSFRIPTTSLGQGGARGMFILGFRVPVTSAGARGEVMRGSKGARG